MTSGMSVQETVEPLEVRLLRAGLGRAGRRAGASQERGSTHTLGSGSTGRERQGVGEAFPGACAGRVCSLPCPAVSC